MIKGMISVVIPNYNYAHFIEETMQSVIDQTYTNWEMIIVDDNSTDNSVEIIESLINKHPNYNIRLLHNKKGPSGTPTPINIGIKNMKGEYFAWLSSDDIFKPEKLKRQIEAFESNSVIDFIFTGYDVIDGKGLVTIKKHINYNKLSKVDLLLESLKQNLINGNTVLIKKKVFDDIDVFQENSEINPEIWRVTEYLKWLEIILKKNVYYVDEKLHFARVHENKDPVYQSGLPEELCGIVIEGFLKENSFEEFYSIMNLDKNEKIEAFETRIALMLINRGRISYYFERMEEIKKYNSILFQKILNNLVKIESLRKVSKAAQLYISKNISGKILLQNIEYEAMDYIDIKSLYNIGSVLKKAENIEKAIFTFEVLIKNNIFENPLLMVGAYYHLGEIYYNKGEADKALNYFEKCLKINSKHGKAKEYLDLLNNKQKKTQVKKKEDKISIKDKKIPMFPYSIDKNKISLYYQPIQGATEEVIGLKPIVVNGNLYPAKEYLKNYHIRNKGYGVGAAEKIIKLIFERKLKSKPLFKEYLWNRVVVISLDCELIALKKKMLISKLKPESIEDLDIAFAENEGELRRKDIYELANMIENKEELAPPLYISGKILEELGGEVEGNTMYMVDGARRLVASSLNHKKNIKISLLILDKEFSNLIKKDIIDVFKYRISIIKWFNNYQTIPLVGLKGDRTLKRFKLFDISILDGQRILDFGCNIGQASIQAIQAGAKDVFGLDASIDTISIAKKIKSILGFKNLNFIKIDFNNPKFEKIIDDKVSGKVDYSFFFSVYRTKELKDRDRLFRYIIAKTRKGIFFEGHAVLEIDTLEYYYWLFDSFDLSYKFLGYSEGNRRPLFYLSLE